MIKKVPKAECNDRSFKGDVNALILIQENEDLGECFPISIGGNKESLASKAESALAKFQENLDNNL